MLLLIVELCSDEMCFKEIISDASSFTSTPLALVNASINLSTRGFSNFSESLSIIFS